jgi:hypothetical protein
MKRMLQKNKDKKNLTYFNFHSSHLALQTTRQKLLVLNVVHLLSSLSLATLSLFFPFLLLLDIIGTSGKLSAPSSPSKSTAQNVLNKIHAQHPHAALLGSYSVGWANGPAIRDLDLRYKSKWRSETKVAKRYSWQKVFFLKKIADQKSISCEEAARWIEEKMVAMGLSLDKFRSSIKTISFYSIFLSTETRVENIYVLERDNV